jgi:hypothetical protein
MSKVRFIGLDVRADTIAVAHGQRIIVHTQANCEW